MKRKESIPAFILIIAMALSACGGSVAPLTTTQSTTVTPSVVTPDYGYHPIGPWQVGHHPIGPWQVGHYKLSFHPGNPKVASYSSIEIQDQSLPFGQRYVGNFTPDASANGIWFYFRDPNIAGTNGDTAQLIWGPNFNKHRAIRWFRNFIFTLDGKGGGILTQNGVTQLTITNGKTMVIAYAGGRSYDTGLALPAHFHKNNGTARGVSPCYDQKACKIALASYWAALAALAAAAFALYKGGRGGMGVNQANYFAVAWAFIVARYTIEVSCDW